jgi:hypothetical protein
MTSGSARPDVQISATTLAMAMNSGGRHGVVAHGVVGPKILVYSKHMRTLIAKGVCRTGRAFIQVQHDPVVEIHVDGSLTTTCCGHRRGTCRPGDYAAVVYMDLGGNEIDRFARCLRRYFTSTTFSSRRTASNGVERALLAVFTARCAPSLNCNLNV